MCATGLHWCATRALMGFTQINTKRPICSPTATRTASSSRLVPHAATGKVCSQSPLWGAETTRSIALLFLLVSLDQIADLSAAMTGASKAHCFAFNALSGGGGGGGGCGWKINVLMQSQQLSLTEEYIEIKYIYCDRNAITTGSPNPTASVWLDWP